MPHPCRSIGGRTRCSSRSSISNRRRRSCWPPPSRRFHLPCAGAGRTHLINHPRVFRLHDSEDNEDYLHALPLLDLPFSIRTKRCAPPSAASGAHIPASCVVFRRAKQRGGTQNQLRLPHLMTYVVNLCCAKLARRTPLRPLSCQLHHNTELKPRAFKAVCRSFCKDADMLSCEPKHRQVR